MGKFLGNKKAPEFNRGLFVFIVNLLAVATSQDNIIEALEAEIIKLKTQLSATIAERDEVKKKFDELKVILRET